MSQHEGREDQRNAALFPERFLPGEMGGLIEAEHLARYGWASAFVAGKRVLDAGCGVGYGSRLLLDCGAASVVGVDIAQEAIDVASAHQSAKGLEFILGDIMALPLPDASVDVAVCFEAIEHVDDQDRALDELRRVLTANGLVAISSPNRDVYEEGNPYHIREYTPGELRAALRERFSNVSLDHQQAWLASMICDERILTERAPTRRLAVDVGKVAAVATGNATFMVALASNASLPSRTSLVILTGADELSDWVKRARSAEDHLTRAQRDLREIEASHRSADAAYKSAADAYGKIEQSYKEAQAALERNQATQDQTEAALEQTEAALEQNRSEGARNRDEIYRSRTMLAERNAALRLATEEMRSLQQREQELRAELATASSTLNRLTQSLSWRITAPLRALSRDQHGG